MPPMPEVTPSAALLPYKETVGISLGYLEALLPENLEELQATFNSGVFKKTESTTAKSL